MGRQINFFQLDSDIRDMLLFLKQHHLNVFDPDGNILTQVKDMYINHLVSINKEYIPSIVSANSPIEYSVPYPLDTTQITEARFYFCNSPNYEVKNTKGMNIIREGRFYLANAYYSDNEIVAVYNMLKKYIQKNYIFSKKRSVYFSPEFIKEYKKGNVYSAQGTNIFPLIDV